MTNPESNRSNLFIPLLAGACVALGIWIGSFLSRNQTFQGILHGNNSSGNFETILDYVQEEYVDSIDREKLRGDAIQALLEQLDPHSAYIPASEFGQVAQQMEGNFDGIGVEFNIQKDTIMVVAAISGGPSEALGIHSGDRIVLIEGKPATGIGITNEQVIKQLRGKRGTKVRVGIFRPGQKKLIQFTITRDKIPIYSLDAHFMVSPDIGYVKINRFSATTVEEYKKAFEELKSNGMKKLILDLRDNPGGYLNAAVALSDEFLPLGKRIVFTKGKARPREDFDATGSGDFEEGGLAILIDEGSASASEIVSGAVQDHDRGWIIGRRSFGKGLVQEEKKFEDGSAMRLTIARYYTPSGRCIQKPYQKNHSAYYAELEERYKNGELSKPDTGKPRMTPVYKTASGRPVYGSGGISPDIFIPLDTSASSDFLSNLFSNGIFGSFAFDFVDGKRSSLLKKYPNVSVFDRSFREEEIMPEFLEFVYKNGIKKDQKGQEKSGAIIRQNIKAMIARSLYGIQGYFNIRNRKDQAVLKAIEVLSTNKSLINHQTEESE